MTKKSRLKTALLFPVDAVVTLGVGCATFAGVVGCCEAGRNVYHMFNDTIDVTRRKRGHLVKKETLTIRCFDGKVLSSK